MCIKKSASSVTRWLVDLTATSSHECLFIVIATCSQHSWWPVNSFRLFNRRLRQLQRRRWVDVVVLIKCDRRFIGNPDVTRSSTSCTVFQRNGVWTEGSGTWYHVIPLPVATQICHPAGRAPADPPLKLVDFFALMLYSNELVLSSICWALLVFQCRTAQWVIDPHTTGVYACVDQTLFQQANGLFQLACFAIPTMREMDHCRTLRLSSLYIYIYLYFARIGSHIRWHTGDTSPRMHSTFINTLHSI